MYHKRHRRIFLRFNLRADLWWCGHQRALFKGLRTSLDFLPHDVYFIPLYVHADRPRLDGDFKVIIVVLIPGTSLVLNQAPISEVFDTLQGVISPLMSADASKVSMSTDGDFKGD